MAEPSVSRWDPEGCTTLLFVPADRPDMLAKAQARGADAIVVDLEDAIAPASKDAARQTLRGLLEDQALEGPSGVCVRVNAVGEGADDDLTALAGTTVDGVIVPKAGDPRHIEHARAAIDRALGDGDRVALIPQVESVRGILGVAELLRSNAVSAIAFGGEDFAVDLGVGRSTESLELLMPRALLALHARAANVPCIDTVYTGIQDEDGLVREARTARQLGFSGKLLIHPGQIEPVRRVFAPSGDEVAWAERVVATQAAGPQNGTGVHVVDGKMVDAPVVAQAQRILARHR